MPPFKKIVLIVSILITSPHLLSEQIFERDGHMPELVELYTSEGCSSCPPADRYLNNLVTSPDLWDKFIPMAFHVDYWDYIGWKDRYAKPAFKQRQYNYRHLGKSRSVYTPGWFVNGAEWRGFFQRQPLPESSNPGGYLHAHFEKDQLRINYTPRQTANKLVANVALLGFDLSSTVTAGENKGRLLQHQFVVLEFLQKSQRPYDWIFTVPKSSQSKRQAMAIWISTPDLIPLQATAGWLEIE